MTSAKSGYRFLMMPRLRMHEIRCRARLMQLETGRRSENIETLSPPIGVIG